MCYTNAISREFFLSSSYCKINPIKSDKVKKGFKYDYYSKSMYRYRDKNIKRIPLDVQKEKYDEIKAAATAAGESVNGYIKKAIDDRMEREAENDE